VVKGAREDRRGRGLQKFYIKRMADGKAVLVVEGPTSRSEG
jgi:hypothetical protein